MGKKIFFLSLIVLSLAMGQHWLKNRSNEPKKPRRPRTAVRLEDLQVQDSPSAPADPVTAGSSETAPIDSDTPIELVASDPLDVPSPTVTDEPVASNTTEVADASGTASVGEDPVLAFFNRLPRTPFEQSPFVIMLEKTGKTEETITEGPAALEKPTQLYAAEFLGTIETDKEVLAIVEKNLLRQGGNFKGMIVTQIATTHVVMENDVGIFVLPKKGVEVAISSGVVMAVTDDFFKRGGRH